MTNSSSPVQPQHLTPSFTLVFLERILEGELLVAVLALERVPGHVASHMALQLVLRLGLVRAVRAGEGPVAVLGDVVPLQLGVSLEGGAADPALLGRRAVVALPMENLKGKVELNY